MKFSKSLAVVWLVIAVAVQAADMPGKAVPKAQVLRNVASMPLAFTENQGQWDEKMLFRADAGGATMWFTKDGAYYQFTRRMPNDCGRQMSTSAPFTEHEPDSIETMMIKASFVGANPDPRIVGEEILEYKCNYFLGNDPAKWRTDVPNYQVVRFEQVYPGIDLKYYGNGKHMEYDFIVSPGADPSQICVLYDGAKSLSVNDAGELVVKTEWGTVTELKPFVYQLEDGSQTPLEGEYVLLSDNTFGFVMTESYKPELALVIDPVLTYSTYLGGGAEDKGWDIAVDGSGNIYITGYTSSIDFPTENPLQPAYGGGDDVFVTKLTADGSELEYSTFLGGSAWDWGLGIALDDAGNAYVTGLTFSTDFPIYNALQPTHGGGPNDAFVVKLNSSGNALVYSTYLGGSSYDDGGDIKVDDAGCAYVAGWTYSYNFPTENPLQPSSGGWADAFIAKLNQGGDALVYSTYLGGSGGDWSRSIALDDAGCAYVTGYTSSSNFPTENAYDSTLGGGWRDAFVTKLNADGNEALYSTYLGGSNDDLGSDIAVNVMGNAYVTGWTYSYNFPTENPLQVSHGGGSNDAFVTKLNVEGNGLVYSTYLGGNSDDEAWGIALDDAGRAYVTGGTSSSNFPTENALQEFSGDWDAFVAQLDVPGDAFIFSSFLGGSGSDADPSYGCAGITVGDDGSIYVTGWTSSSDFPIFPTEDPLQAAYGGGTYDAFVAKISTVTSLQVYFDIKPGSCPNPLNVKSAGIIDVDDRDGGGNMATGGGINPALGERVRGGKAVFPVAILGTAEFDVAMIDATTVVLAGVPVVRWNYEDVATPVAEDAEECDCNTDGPDGFVDWTAKFYRDDIIAALGDVYYGDIIPLTISGQLVDGTPFEGVDCVVIRTGGNAAPPKGPVNDDPAMADINNYPNPFNPMTTISFSLPVASDASLTIYNVMGQKVATVADGFYEAGRHAVEWDGSSVASGVYFYRLETDAYTETKKMMLLK